MKCVRFFRKDNKTISHNIRETFSAFGASVTIVNQKNERRFDAITQENTGDHQLNPVTLAASFVSRIRKIPGTSDDSLICCYHSNYKLLNIAQAMILDYLRKTAFGIGENKLGFKPDEIGNKSMRSGACMAWFFAYHPVEHVKMMGR